MTNGVEVSFPGLGWTFNVNPVAFRIGGIEVYWYGLLIALALVLSVILAVKQAKSLKFPEGLVYDTIRNADFTYVMQQSHHVYLI